MQIVTSDSLRVSESKRGGHSPLIRTMHRMIRNQLVVMGATVIGLITLIAIVGPSLVSQSPTEMNTPERLQGPSRAHPFGTDDFGRDVFSRVVSGASLSLRVGVVAVALGSVAGGLLGLFTGFAGGWVDRITQSLLEIWMAFPDLILALGIVAVLGPNLVNVMIALAISSVPAYTRLTRGQVLALREKEYVIAARSCGARTARLVFRHILPNALSPLIVFASISIAGAILSASAFSFLGLGAQPPTAEWGAMLAAGRAFLRNAWWVATFPGVAIAITVLGFNVLGDGLRDVLDPRAQD